MIESGDGLESAARDARYKVFEKLLVEGGILPLAIMRMTRLKPSHRLLRLRLQGLAGIPVIRYQSAAVVGPPLSWPRAALQSYAEAKELRWIEDESNQQLQFDRNYLRHRVVPALAERWPDYVQGISRSAMHSNEADQLAESVARADLDSLDCRQERAGWSLCLEKFKQLELLRQRNLALSLI